MDFHDWLLALHVLSAFALVAAYVLFGVLIVTSWRLETPSAVAGLMRVSRWGTILVGIGSIGTLVLGIWLAIEDDAYEIWNGWIIAALILWAFALALGGRGGTYYAAAGTRAQELVEAGNDAPDPTLGEMLRSRTALWLQVGSSVLVLLLLIVMIWKPGA